ncbi:MAG: hypothetical protein JKY93_04735 [Gammaproteobacteria bacterium]|nr:hypothetical protein [Gammaproteobacteria bacterium]
MQNLQYSLAILLTLAVTGLHAETLNMPAQAILPTAEMPDTAKPIITINPDLPTRGMNMLATEEQFGAPINKTEAVGEPPISRWEYDGFTVYFEHQYVLHSVDRSEIKK